jgi:hypothetical protein
MAKKYPNKDDSTFENSDEANFKQSEGKRYNVVYKDNASMEITVGGELLRFEAHKLNPVHPEKYKDGVPESVINHPDFKWTNKYFTITEKN